MGGREGRTKKLGGKAIANCLNYCTFVGMFENYFVFFCRLRYVCAHSISLCRGLPRVDFVNVAELQRPKMTMIGVLTRSKL